jgi:hypothetical protein
MIARAETIDWKFAATALIRAIDPSYAGPCYMLDVNEAGTELDHCTAGITWPFLDVALRDTLRARGEWEGSGFACIVDSAFYLTKHSEFEAIRGCVSIVLHEYCHWVTQPEVPNESVVDDLFELCPDLARSVQVPASIAPRDPKQVPWHNHTGDKFGRMALHAMVRAHRAAPEFEFFPFRFWNSERVYQLAEPIKYFRALGREPIERLVEPLRAIAASPLPDPYADFCNQDLSRAQAELTSSKGRSNDDRSSN